MEPVEVNDRVGEIKNQRIAKLRDFLSVYLKTRTDSGEIDLPLIMKNAAYNMGDGGVEIGALIMQEQLKLSKLRRSLKDRRAEVLLELKGKRLPFPPSQKDIDTLTDSDAGWLLCIEDEDDRVKRAKPSVSELNEKVEIQEAYVEFLKSAQEQIRFFSRNADVLVNLHNVAIETGKLI